ncbi:RidA family protein [Alkalicoccus daliensis]|uniref:2-iminobutanoate/2-iminopropanoate deaminase n=1 Tax=Alkalicoccus daliensis TaxID=745820 RepID=A0A1H0K5J7_9BACI|nr:RidA family protein [Alkalicoccus daliensis]SDO51053.1 2-iminobutanoate/2-iminopropanoate deaminase [Alkalicoccus daliensis]
MTKKIIHTNMAPEAIGPYSQAVEVNGFVYTSGQIGLDPETGEMTKGVEAQAHQVMKNVSSILKAAGLDNSKIVKAMIFLQDMEDFSLVNDIYASYLTEPYPARSAVEISKMPKGALVEVEVIAVKE